MSFSLQEVDRSLAQWIDQCPLEELPKLISLLELSQTSAWLRLIDEQTARAIDRASRGVRGR